MPAMPRSPPSPPPGCAIRRRPLSRPSIHGGGFFDRQGSRLRPFPPSCRRFWRWSRSSSFSIRRPCRARPWSARARPRAALPRCARPPPHRWGAGMPTACAYQNRQCTALSHRALTGCGSPHPSSIPHGARCSPRPLQGRRVAAPCGVAKALDSRVAFAPRGRPRPLPSAPAGPPPAAAGEWRGRRQRRRQRRR